MRDVNRPAMTDDPLEIIEALKAQFGTQTDADLARRLSIDKSTISSWKARGSVPRRFRAILSGASPSFFAISPMGWGEHEKNAFEIALFRFTRARAEVALEGDHEKCLEAFTSSGEFWVLMLEAQKQLLDRQGDGRHSPDTAQALAIHDLLDEGDAAIARDCRLLAPVVRGDEKTRTRK